MPREPLGEEEITGGPVDGGNGRVAGAMEGVESVEAGALLPRPPRELEPARREPPA